MPSRIETVKRFQDVKMVFMKTFFMSLNYLNYKLGKIQFITSIELIYEYAYLLYQLYSSSPIKKPLRITFSITLEKNAIPSQPIVVEFK